VQAQSSCTGISNNFNNPSKGSCMKGWSRNNDYAYPEDFGDILNEVTIYTCNESNKRIIISNGIPDHDIRQANPNIPCETNWAISMPLNPSVASSKTEVPVRGVIAMSLNGVPAYGPQEGGGSNAVEPGNGFIQDAQFWYGHADQQKQWHFHNPYMGTENPSSDTLLGYALDGFPIYGPLNDSSSLDKCNGQTVNGKYQYHVVETNEVNQNLSYCKGNDAANNWNYVLGCYSGTIGDTQVNDSTSFNIPSDCTTDDSGCTQNGSDAFFVKINKKGKPMLRNCDWLASSSNKSNICNKKVNYYDSYSPAQDICQATCESCDVCYQNNRSKFYFRTTNSGAVKTKKCMWLIKRDSETISDICSSEESSGGYGPASLQCPVTCSSSQCE
jgi:hypothetical protein